jgi:hypothetical protein
MPLPDPVQPPTCTIAGYLLDVAGRPRVGVPVRVRNLEVPMTTDALNWVSGAGITVKSDGTGLVAFRLIQGAVVQVDHPYRPDITLRRTVPAVGEINLVAWLFPYITEVRYEGPTPLSIERNHYVPLDLVAVLSDGTEVEVLPKSLAVLSSDEGVVRHMSSGLFGEGAGAATITIESVDQGFLPTNLTSEDEVLAHVNLPPPVLPGPVSVVVT